MNTRIGRVLTFVFIFATSIGAVAQESADFKQGYADGFKDGFDEGYRKAKAEQGADNAAASKGFPIALTSATYGPDSGSSCDAHRFVAPKVNGRRSASIGVTNQMCGDPSPGNRKSLKITYLCGSLAKTTSAYEHRTAYLSCD
ncbi:MAG: SUEL-type lectin domain-containing protein [Burkholderiales bacterium]|nr:SUEL-type lectin domain-containing protein [Burkholderiales bacterium]